jgi:endonuclease G, mitochondrial
MNKEQLDRLREYNRHILAKDDVLRKSVPAIESTAPVEESLEGLESFADPLAEESIVLRSGRPVFTVQNNGADFELRRDADAAVWTERLVAAKGILSTSIPAVGRIDVVGHYRLDWVGTGWLVAEDVIVTNRHVAAEFALQGGEGFVFKPGFKGPMDASVDFLQEAGNVAKAPFRLTRVLHIEPAGGPDLAFFAVERTGTSVARPIALAAELPSEIPQVAVIGYPARDSRVPEADLMTRIFGELYDKKRLAPGAVRLVDEKVVIHDCSTLGGNSGSVVLDLKEGIAVGLHFSGRFLEANYAVRSDIVKKRLDGLRRGVVSVPRAISLELESNEEGRVDDYADRTGYDPDFLGKKVPLPTVERNASDVLAVGGTDETVLRYQNFSVVMSKSRRMCIYSAVNINGGLSKKTTRSSWRFDPRIPKAQQIKAECYGDPPKFSRGHMTRREDPAWGTRDQARLGNDDSMHVTNAVPQMQEFNSPIWLALEDYALQHAREDEMNISVFTGPFFKKDDPFIYEVQIPRDFWKIIAFIHDKTGKLCATGYRMSQEANLPVEDEFIYSQFRSPQANKLTQVTIASIERASGLRFGDLSKVDPKRVGDEEGIDDEEVPITRIEQICFV